MKNNNRNRKLKYIRAKNNLRLGITVFKSVSKISKEMFSDVNYGLVSRLILKQAETDLYRKFKLKLRNHTIKTWYEGDDFINDCYTVVCRLDNLK